MSNLEHLIENGLYCLKETKDYKKWYTQMYDDPNWAPFVGITIDDLWAICQYVIYTYCWGLEEDIYELRARVYGGKNESSM